LESLAPPKLTASCKGASFRKATSRDPLVVVSGKRFTSGFQLTGATCTSTFTWALGDRYGILTADLYLDRAGSGPLQVVLHSGTADLPFSANGKSVNKVNLGESMVHIRSAASGESFAIILPGRRGDVGSVDVTADHLATRTH
jgi:hypothetical protein